jgi:hypothetical protein
LRKLKLSIALLGLGLCVWAAPVRAESLEAEPIIGGKPMRCVDFRGAVVRTLRVTELGDVAWSRIVMRTPVIMLDSNRLTTLPGPLQIFFYIHECAHHVLAHHFNMSLSSEKDADCFSIKFGRERGLFNRADVAAFAPYFAKSKGSPRGHLPGPERSAYLLHCFDDPAPMQSAEMR